MILNFYRIFLRIFLFEKNHELIDSRVLRGKKDFFFFLKLECLFNFG